MLFHFSTFAIFRNGFGLGQKYYAQVFVQWLRTLGVLNMRLNVYGIDKAESKCCYTVLSSGRG